MFIAVNALNGFGVFTKQEKIDAIDWMKEPIEKEFESFIKAKLYAIEIYNDPHNAYEDRDEYYDSKNDPKFRINWFYSKSYIKKLNKN